MIDAFQTFIYFCIAMIGFFVGRIMTAVQYEVMKSWAKDKKNSLN